MAWGVAVTSMAALKVLPLVVTLTYLMPTVDAQVPFLARCPRVDTRADFLPEKYLGKWYEAERYFAIFELGGKCVTANYSMKDDGIIGVVNQQISSLTGIRSSIEGDAKITDPAEQAKLAVRFPSLPVPFDAPYWILDTDYDTFAVVWSCNNLGFFSTRNAWLLTRERNPSIEVMQKAYSVIDRSGISRAFFIRTDQVNCPDGH
ncbi:apolipoprotein D-like [Hetaerina americana]|uniref:apolipoprotein D-like n=1 Tax=Hetaerina americana TaxID=62018 RepID=UPI003A7F2E57